MKDNMNEEILRNLNYRIDKALDYTRHLVEDEKMPPQIEEAKLNAEIFIAENPIKAVAGGLVAGYLLGKIFSDD